MSKNQQAFHVPVLIKIIFLKIYIILFNNWSNLYAPILIFTLNNLRSNIFRSPTKAVIALSTIYIRIRFKILEKNKHLYIYYKYLNSSLIQSHLVWYFLINPLIYSQVSDLCIQHLDFHEGILMPKLPENCNSRLFFLKTFVVF